MDNATADLISHLETCDPHDTDDVIKHLNAAARELRRLSREVPAPDTWNVNDADERARLVRMLEQWQEFVTLEDGYVYYWPNPKRAGAISPPHLRIIAEELDRRNADWDRQVQEDLNHGG